VGERETVSSAKRLPLSDRLCVRKHQDVVKNDDAALPKLKGWVLLRATRPARCERIAD
jgi:hypothetical protein